MKECENKTGFPKTFQRTRIRLVLSFSFLASQMSVLREQQAKLNQRRRYASVVFMRREDELNVVLVLSGLRNGLKKKAIRTQHFRQNDA
jgi:hypothetical protein